MGRTHKAMDHCQPSTLTMELLPAGSDSMRRLVHGRLETQNKNADSAKIILDTECRFCNLRGVGSNEASAKPKKKMSTHQEQTISRYNASTAKIHVFLSRSADGKWIAALHGKETTGEWFAISKDGEIVASGTKQAVNRTLNNAGFRPSKTEADAWS